MGLEARCDPHCGLMGGGKGVHHVDGWGCIGAGWISPAEGYAGGNDIVSGAPVGWWYSRIAIVMVWGSRVPGVSLPCCGKAGWG